MPFVGYFDALTGVPQQLFRITSSNETYGLNGFTTRILNEDQFGDILGGAFFSVNPFSVYKLSTASATMSW